MAEALSALVAVFLDKLAAVIPEEASTPLGVRSELEALAGTVKLVRSLLADAENKAFHSETIRLWLKELKDVIHDADDLVEDCKAAAVDPDDDPAPPSAFSGKLPEPSSSAGLVRTALSASMSFLHRVVFHRRVAQRLRGINTRIEEISRERSQLRLVPDLEENSSHRARSIRYQASSGLVETDITGETIRLDAKKLVGVLVRDGSCGMDLVAITGMGGIGKTTLAQVLYGDQFITANFQIKIWVCVSKDFSANKLLREIISGAGVYAGETHTRAQLELMLGSLAQGKKVFLVLDDVCLMINAFLRIVSSPCRTRPNITDSKLRGKFSMSIESSSGIPDCLGRSDLKNGWGQMKKGACTSSISHMETLSHLSPAADSSQPT